MMNQSEYVINILIQESPDIVGNPQGQGYEKATHSYGTIHNGYKTHLYDTTTSKGTFTVTFYLKITLKTSFHEHIMNITSTTNQFTFLH